jgi:hypothetical protein
VNAGGAELGDGEVRLLELDGVHHQQPDPSAPLDAVVGEQVGGAVHPVVELGEGEPAAGVEVDEGLEIRVEQRSLRDEVPDVRGRRRHRVVIADHRRAV